MPETFQCATMQRFAKPTLVLDASCPRLFVGVAAAGSDAWSATAATGEPVLESLFGMVSGVLGEAGLALDDIGTFLYCRGPGSVLGLRLCAMAITTWNRLLRRPADLLAYESLVLAAHCVAADAAGEDRFLVVGDWRKDRWNAVAAENGRPGPVHPLDSAGLAAAGRPVYRLPQRKGWQDPPAGAIDLAYRPERLIEFIDRPGLVGAAAAVELFDAGASRFRKWTPARHRAGTGATGEA